MCPLTSVNQQYHGNKTISKYKYISFIEAQGTKPQKQHGNVDVATTFAHSYVIPKYVTDVATLIATSAESRQLFLTKVTRACLEATKKEEAETNQTDASQLVKSPTNTNTTATKTVYSTSTHENPSTKPVTMTYNTSGATINKKAEEGSKQIVVQDLTKDLKLRMWMCSLELIYKTLKDIIL